MTGTADRHSSGAATRARRWATPEDGAGVLVRARQRGALVRARPGFRRRDRARASVPWSSGPLPGSSRHGRRRRRARWPCACCSTSSRATSGAARRAPFPATLRARGGGAAIARRPRPRAAAEPRLFLYLPFEHSEDLADQERCVALMRALGDAEHARLRAAPPRRDRPLRPLPASQCDPRPYQQRGGGRVPDPARLVVLIRCLWPGRPKRGAGARRRRTGNTRLRPCARAGT